MDKGCRTCAHWEIPTYKSPCSECVKSGTVSRWTARTCENCTNRFLLGLKNGPCKACFAGKVYSEWKGSPTDAELAQTAEDMKPDNVNHPTHYTSGCGFECIEMMEMVFGKEAVIDFCVVNAFKYIWRHEQKNGTEDIAKAEWYLKYACKLTEGGLRRHQTAIDKMTDHIEKLKGEAAK